jgi:glycosyltransferase involved in cell wall biosynthesis
MKKTLVLFTLNYPFGNGEEFIENEIKVASKSFSEIIIVPNSDRGLLRPIPLNAKIIKWSDLTALFEKPNLFEFIKLMMFEMMLYKKYSSGRIKSILVAWNYYKQQFERSIKIKYLLQKLSNDDSAILLYDFWSTNNGLAITLAKNKYPNVNYIACTHNFDLYDFRWKCPIPFRNVCINAIDAIFPDSQYGANYLNSKIPDSLKHKVDVAYMGTPDFGMSPISTNEKIRIVSCSSCISHKRVDWVIEALSKLENIEFEWVHFGDGQLFKELQETAEKLLPTDSFKFYGWVTFNELIEYYQKNSVDVFVHMSNAEGLPVSLMIASSFGIPIVAVDCMGVSELINQKTGYLLPFNCTIQDASFAITEILNTMSKSIELRKNARQYCMQHFSLDNYERFYNEKLKFVK